MPYPTNFSGYRVPSLRFGIIEKTKSLLALRTIVRSSSRHHDFLDRRLALQARFAFAAIGAMLDLEKTFFAIGVYVI